MSSGCGCVCGGGLGALRSKRCGLQATTPKITFLFSWRGQGAIQGRYPGCMLLMVTEQANSASVDDSVSIFDF